MQYLDGELFKLVLGLALPTRARDQMCESSKRAMCPAWLAEDDWDQVGGNVTR